MSGLPVGPQPVLDARQARLFYGWIVVACTFTILSVAYGIQFSFGVFIHPMSAETGWDRAQLSLPYSLYVFVYSALGLVSGRLTDRLGPRVVLSIGGGLLAGGLVLVSRVHTLWQLYLALGLIAAAGMSAAYVPCNATVVRWFTVRRGLALSITSSGSSFGMFVFPPIATALIAHDGWRGAYLTLGVVAAAVIVAAAAFIARDPEARGLLPDGLPAAPQFAPAVANSSADEEWTLPAAQGTRAFWIMTTIFALTWLVVFMPMVHIVPFAVDLGISEFRAAMALSVIGFAGFAGRVAIGPISDRLGRVSTLGLSLLLQAVAFLGFAFSRGPMLLYPSAAIFGFSYGAISALFPALVGDFFGRLAIGAIVGFIFALAGSPAAFGPMIAGYLFAATNSYTLAFELSAVLNLAALILLACLKRPRREHDEASAITDASRSSGVPPY
jgi:MFS transporter, OFA family, oxalate/formate antiporter